MNEFINGFLLPFQTIIDWMINVPVGAWGFVSGIFTLFIIIFLLYISLLMAISSYLE
jgi:hypothetical protein